MKKKHTGEEKERYQSYLRTYLKNDPNDLSVEEQIEEVQKRDQSKWWHLLLNVAAILFFGYSFYYDITQLSNTFFIIILVVFVINVGLILYQKKQIRELLEYLEREKERGEPA